MKFTIEHVDFRPPAYTPLTCSHGKRSGGACLRCGAVVPWINGNLNVWQRALDRVLRWMKGRGKS